MLVKISKNCIVEERVLIIVLVIESGPGAFLEWMLLIASLVSSRELMIGGREGACEIDSHLSIPSCLS